MRGYRCPATRVVKLGEYAEADVRCMLHDFHGEWDTPHIARQTVDGVRITYAWDLLASEAHGKLAKMGRE